MPGVLKRATRNGGPDGEPYGWLFWCLGCKETHVIQTEEIPGLPGRPVWGFDGNVAAPTFTPSLLIRYRRLDEFDHCCHTFVRGGCIEYLGDCTHELAGQTVDMVDYETALAEGATP